MVGGLMAEDSVTVGFRDRQQLSFLSSVFL